MTKRFHILVTDRNRRVRQYLVREMVAQGYLTGQAGSEEELWRALALEKDLDLVILDPEIAHRDPDQVFRRLRSIRPELPVIIHTLEDEPPAYTHPDPRLCLVFKSGPSVERLKEAVTDLLSHPYLKQSGAVISESEFSRPENP